MDIPYKIASRLWRPCLLKYRLFGYCYLTRSRARIANFTFPCTEVNTTLSKLRRNLPNAGLYLLSTGITLMFKGPATIILARYHIIACNKQGRVHTIGIFPLFRCRRSILYIYSLNIAAYIFLLLRTAESNKAIGRNLTLTVTKKRASLAWRRLVFQTFSFSRVSIESTCAETLRKRERQFPVLRKNFELCQVVPEKLWKERQYLSQHLSKYNIW